MTTVKREPDSLFGMWTTLHRLRVLHLSRKFRSHQRQVIALIESKSKKVGRPKLSLNAVFQVCKEEQEAIKVDVHEGCGRVKFFWILRFV